MVTKQMADNSEVFRKQPRQSRSRAVVSAILGAAEEVVSRGEDTETFSLQGLARRAGVGIGSLYDYFATRDGVLGALLNRVSEDNFERLVREVDAFGQLPIEQLMPLMVKAALRVYLDNPKRTRTLVLTIGRLGWMKAVVSERDRFARLLSTRVVQAHPRVDPAHAKVVAEVLCDALIGVVLGELWRERTPAERAQVEAELEALVVSAVRGLTTPQQ